MKKKKKGKSASQSLKVVSWNSTMGGKNVKKKVDALVDEVVDQDANLLLMQEAPPQKDLDDIESELQRQSSQSWELFDREQETLYPGTPNTSVKRYYAAFARKSQVQLKSGKAPAQKGPPPKNAVGTRKPQFLEAKVGGKTVNVVNFHNESPGLHAKEGMKRAMEDVDDVGTGGPTLFVSDTNLKSGDRKPYLKGTFPNQVGSGNYDVIASTSDTDLVKRPVKKARWQGSFKGDHAPVAAELTPH